VPLAESVEAFFEREVKRHVPDAWIDTDKRDPKDGQVGIEADIRGIEQDILRMLSEVTGGSEGGR